MTGAQIFTAIDRTQALKVVKSNLDIDWVFLDVYLPDIDGIELKRSFEAKKITPNIVLSSDSSPSVTDRALKQYANGILSKSFSQSELRSCINTIEQGKIYHSPRLNWQLEGYRNSVLAERQSIKASN